MTPQERQDLREKAKAATPGTWTWEDDPPTLYAGRDNRNHGYNLLGRMQPDGNGNANLDYIAAASPSAILELLDEVERLESDLNTMTDAYNGAVADGGLFMQERNEAREDVRRIGKAFRRINDFDHATRQAAYNTITELETKYQKGDEG